MTSRQLPTEQNAMEQRTLGEIAVTLPGATTIFRAAGLDYSWNGQTTLRDAAATRSLNLEQILAKLSSLPQENISSLADLDTKALTEVIITRFHRPHGKELPELVELAARIETVHKDHPAVPAGLASLLQQILGELTMHMQKEEIVLFPQMNKDAKIPPLFPITTMIAEHQEHGAHLDQIRKLSNNFSVPEDGCATWRALYAGLAKFADDLIEHVHIENNILFPRFAADTK